MSGSVRGWSGEGHEAVARIASSFIKRSTVRFLSETLGAEMADVPKKLEEVSTWADKMKKESGNEWTGVWHFANTDYRSCRQFNYATDCSNRHGCVVSAINRFTERAIDVGLNKYDRATALKFLVHFVGDLHSPVHMGFKEDAGGGGLNVKLASNNRTLHEVWDSDVLTFARKTSADGRTLVPLLDYTKLDTRLGKSIDSATVFDRSAFADYSASMATDVIMRYTCDSAYTHVNSAYIENNDPLDTHYMQLRSGDAVNLLQMAGVRLGQLLNAISDAYARNTSALRIVVPSLRVSPKKDATPKKQSHLAGLDFSSDSEDEDHGENNDVSNTEVESEITDIAPPSKKSKATA
jgi:hypothetical protein